MASVLLPTPWSVFFATVFFLQLGEFGSSGFLFGSEGIDRSLFLGKIMGDDQFRHEVTGPAFVLFLAVLSSPECARAWPPSRRLR